MTPPWPFRPRHYTSPDLPLHVGVARRPSCISVSSVTVDVDSCASSPGIVRRDPRSELTFAEMKRALAEPSQREKEEAERERRLLVEKFQTASFRCLLLIF